MNKEVRKHQVAKNLVLITQFGISMIVPIALCMFLGMFVADKLSAPIITVPFFILGALAGFRNVWILARSTFEDDKKKEQGKDEERQQRP